jgi:hypothetical protein
MRPRRGLNLGLPGTGAVSLVSGFLVQITYHMHHGIAVRAARLVWGLGYPAWALIHQVALALKLAIANWHLWLNRKPLLALLKRDGRWRRQVPIFIVVFTLAVTTAVAAWTAGGRFAGQVTERRLVEIHVKVTIPMSILMVPHAWQRRAPRALAHAKR